MSRKVSGKVGVKEGRKEGKVEQGADFIDFVFLIFNRQKGEAVSGVYLPERCLSILS